MGGQSSRMTPMELKGLSRGGLLLLALSLARWGWEEIRSSGELLVGVPDEGPVLLESARKVRGEETLRSAPLLPGEGVDPNRAGEDTLDRLPGVGPSTARALVRDRQENGPFLRAEDLLRVRGIGTATLERIRPFLDFSGGVPMELRRGKGVEERRAGGTSSLLRSHAADPPTAPGLAVVAVNRASLEELQSLPGIGPALAGRIVESRAKEGAFHRPEDLLRVPGIGPATLDRIRSRISLKR